MNVTMTVGSIFDTIQEVIVFKSGVYLNFDEIKDFLLSIKSSLSDVLLKYESNEYHRFRPEEIEFIINEIRVRIGELPDSHPFPIIKLIKDFPEAQLDLEKIIGVLNEGVEWHTLKYGVEKPLGNEFVNYLIKKSGASRNSVELVFCTLAQTLNRSITYEQSIKSWDGIVRLSDLFDSEVLPNSSETYFDQRYIDYLSKNVESLYNINWRQFEGLTAEFFKRNGFDVKLGSGRKDGGIDVYAIDKNTDQLLIIQCKRYSKKNTVDVNVVKALYFDIVDKKANHALIATTSEICKDGKDIIARKYPISAAEHENIIQWVKSMETLNKL